MSSMNGAQLSFPRMTPGVKALILINAGVFFANLILGGTFSAWFGVSTANVFDGFGLGVLRLVTYQFVHAYLDPWHFIMNMLILYFFGTMVEASIGRRGIFKLYMMSGVLGAVLQLLISVAMDGGATMVGASGSAYGIMVYAAVLAPTSNVLFFGVLPIQLRWLVGILVFAGLYMTVLQFREGVSDGVAHGAHLGGALFGFVAAKFIRTYFVTSDHRPFFGGIGAKFQAWKSDRARRAKAERDATVDALLDKVSREGMSALTPSERKALERASKDMNQR